jgi:hypothetical protein
LIVRLPIQENMEEDKPKYNETHKQQEEKKMEYLKQRRILTLEEALKQQERNIKDPLPQESSSNKNK